MNINSLTIIYGLGAITFFYIAYYSLAYNGRSRTYRTYALLNITMGIWSIVDLLKSMAISGELYLQAKSLDFWYFPAIFLFFYFSLIISKKEFITKKSFVIPYYSAMLIFVLTFLFFLQPIQTNYQDGWYTSVWSENQIKYYKIIISIPVFMALLGTYYIYKNLYLNFQGGSRILRNFVLLIFVLPVLSAIITHYFMDILFDINFYLSLTAYFVLPNIIFSILLNRNINPNFTFEGMIYDILHNNRDILIITNENKEILFVNAAFKKRTGLSENEIKRMHIGFIFKQFLKEYTDEKNEFSKPLEFNEKECIFISKDKKSSHVNIIISSAIDREKNSKGYLYVIQDINKRKKLERQIHQLSVAVEQTDNTVVITDPAGNIEYANPAFEKITGYKINSVVGKNPRFLKSGKHTESFYKNFWNVISSGKTWYGDFHNRKKDGSFYWERCTVTPVMDDSKKIINYIAVKDDITKEKQLKEFQNDIERMMRHDIKTPLNGILNFPDMIMQNPNLTNNDKELLILTKEAGKQILNQIDLFMNLSKLEEGKFIYDPISCNIENILKNITKDLSSIISTKKIEILFFLNNKKYSESEKILLKIDKTLFYTIFSNIIKNAIEASFPGQKVTINIITQFPEKLTITVHNEIPIPIEIRNTFFDKYTSMGKRTGTGLGTYSAKLMVEAMNGQIYFKTRDGDGSHPEDGTTIFVEFPNNV